MWKKAALLTLSAAFLVGCAGGNESTGSTDMDVTVDTTIAEDTSQEVDESESVDTSVHTSGGSDTSTTTLEDNQAEGILFVPQQSDIDSGFTVENDEALGMLEQLILEADLSQVGIDNDVAVQFTGLYLDHPEAKDAIFLIVNRTDMSMTNMEFMFSIATQGGEVIMENEPIQLPEDTFGVLEPNTAMPLYVTIDPAMEEPFLQMVEERGEQLSMESFTFQEMNEETQGRGSGGG